MGHLHKFIKHHNLNLPLNFFLFYKMPTEYQLLSLNETNPNNSDEGSTVIPMVTRGAFAIPRSSISRQERRAPIPWYLDTCKLTKVWTTFSNSKYCNTYPSHY
jgi:hypothetical protein